MRRLGMGDGELGGMSVRTSSMLPLLGVLGFAGGGGVSSENRERSSSHARGALNG